jgi:hypothetical protein
VVLDNISGEEICTLKKLEFLLGFFPLSQQQFSGQLEVYFVFIARKQLHILNNPAVRVQLSQTLCL